MKIVLTGATGFIGGEVFQQCVKNSAVSSVLVLSRKPLSDPLVKDPKVRVLLVEDFLSYSDDVMNAISGADACIWSLGLARFPDMETARIVSVDYTLYAAKEILKGAHQPLRFIYLSGMLTEKDQSKPLWFMQTARRIRGQLESDLLNLAKDDRDHIDAYIVRPGAVLPAVRTLLSTIMGLITSVPVDRLAASMIRLAVEGGETKVLENSML